MNGEHAVMNWSGGKDCAMALMRARAAGKYRIASLMTTVSRKYSRISMHGVRVELLEQQVDSLGLPLVKVEMPDEPAMDVYNRIIKNTLIRLARQGITISVYGDIFLEDLRQYREEQMQLIGFGTDFPVWNIPTVSLAKSFIDSGFKAIVVCVDERYLDDRYAGREFNYSFLEALPGDVDPCGENGEFHTFVYDGPMFKKPVSFKKGDTVYRTFKSPGKPGEQSGFWYCDLMA